MNIGVEIVGSALLDGAGRRDKVVVVEVGDGLEMAFIGAEDLIAERVAQYRSSPTTMEAVFIRRLPFGKRGLSLLTNLTLTSRFDMKRPACRWPG